MSYPFHTKERAQNFLKLWNRSPLILRSINTNVMEGSQRRLPENKGSMLVRIVVMYVLINISSYPKTRRSSLALLPEHTERTGEEALLSALERFQNNKTLCDFRLPPRC